MYFDIAGLSAESHGARGRRTVKSSIGRCEYAARFLGEELGGEEIVARDKEIMSCG